MSKTMKKVVAFGAALAMTLGLVPVAFGSTTAGVSLTVSSTAVTDGRITGSDKDSVVQTGSRSITFNPKAAAQIIPPATSVDGLKTDYYYPLECVPGGINGFDKLMAPTVNFGNGYTGTNGGATSVGLGYTTWGAFPYGTVDPATGAASQTTNEYISEASISQYIANSYAGYFANFTGAAITELYAGGPLNVGDLVTVYVSCPEKGYSSTYKMNAYTSQTDALKGKVAFTAYIPPALVGQKITVSYSYDAHAASGSTIGVLTATPFAKVTYNKSDAGVYSETIESLTNGFPVASNIVNITGADKDPITGRVWASGDSRTLYNFGVSYTATVNLSGSFVINSIAAPEFANITAEEAYCDYRGDNRPYFDVRNGYTATYNGVKTPVIKVPADYDQLKTGGPSSDLQKHIDVKYNIPGIDGRWLVDMPNSYLSVIDQDGKVILNDSLSRFWSYWTIENGTWGVCYEDKLFYAALGNQTLYGWKDNAQRGQYSTWRIAFDLKLNKVLSTDVKKYSMITEIYNTPMQTVTAFSFKELTKTMTVGDTLDFNTLLQYADATYAFDKIPTWSMNSATPGVLTGSNGNYTAAVPGVALVSAKLATMDAPATILVTVNAPSTDTGSVDPTDEGPVGPDGYDLYYVTAPSGLRIRAKATTSSTKKYVVPFDEEVWGTPYNSKWIEVEYTTPSGTTITGYMSSTYLDLVQ